MPSSFYSYTISMLLLCLLLLNSQYLLYIFQFGPIHLRLSFCFGALTALCFAILTGGLFSSSLRRVLQGILRMDEIKKRQLPRLSPTQIARRAIYPREILAMMSQFQDNWAKQFDVPFSFAKIIFPFI